MPLSEKDHQLISQFIAGSLSDEQATEFAARKGEQDFSRELDFQIDLSSAAKQLGRDQLKGKLQDIETGLPGHRAVRKITPRVWWAAAASIAIFAILYSVIDKGAVKHEALYAEFFEPVPNIVSPISKSTDLPQDTFARAFRFYELGNYVEAAKLFTMLDHSDPGVAFYSAVTEMHLESWTSAQDALERIADDEGHEFTKPAEWYLGLLYLKRGKRDQCQSILDIIVTNPDHPFLEEARELLQEL